MNVILFGKRDFVDEIKDFEIKRLPWNTWVGAVQSHTLREAKGNLTSEKEGAFSATKARCHALALTEEPAADVNTVFPEGFGMEQGPAGPLISVR